MFCLHSHNTDTMKNTTELNGVEKVLWKYSYNFHLQNGKTEEEATKLAYLKIEQKRELAKTLTYKF